MVDANVDMHIRVGYSLAVGKLHCKPTINAKTIILKLSVLLCTKITSICVDTSNKLNSCIVT